MPGLDQACERILPPLSGQGQYTVACDVEEVLWPVPDQRRDAGAE